jgi:hypothetical protein
MVADIGEGVRPGLLKLIVKDGIVHVKGGFILLAIVHGQEHV